MLRISQWIWAVAVGVMCTVPVMAQESVNLKKIKDRKAITLGVREASSPFSYLDDKNQYVGYSIDLCMKIVESVKSTLNMPDLKVNLTKVNPYTRTQMVVGGEIE